MAALRLAAIVAQCPTCHDGGVRSSPTGEPAKVDRETARQVGLTAYILYGVSIFIPPVGIGAVIFAHYKRPHVAGTYIESHMTFLIRTFWLTVLFSIIGFVLAIVAIGFLILFVVGVWYIFRIVKGFVVFNDGQPLADPEGWL